MLLTRLHGLGPMGGTDLDAVLRNLGVTTVVGIGVSVNIGMMDFAFDAVNAGYQMVMPRDAVAGVPAEYAQAVLDNTLALVATLPSTDDVLRRLGRDGLTPFSRRAAGGTHDRCAVDADDVPDVADALAHRVARLAVAREAIERLAVRGDLLRAVGPRDEREVWSDQALAGGDRWPPRAGASLWRRRRRRCYAPAGVGR